METLTPEPPLVRFDSRDAIAVALRLALGQPRAEDAHADWGLVFQVASRELLAALAWRRSGLFIRRHADAPLTATWRRSAIATQVRGEAQLALLADAIRALDAAGIEVVVLKGMPLGAHLYGDPFVRCSADIDLYVPDDERSRAGAALAWLGWRSIDGVAPWHESWSLSRSDGEYILELHSRLVSDHLAHVVTPPPASARETIAGVDLPVHVGEFVPAYLAAHLATHQLPPLLWLVDFAALWGSLAPHEREAATAVAQRSGLGRYLEWAQGRAALVEHVADGDWDALGILGIGATSRHDRHSIWRHVALAASGRDRLRLFGAFVVPHRVRGDVRQLVRYTGARIRTRLRSLLGASRPYSVPSVTTNGGGRPSWRALRVEREEMIALTRDGVGVGSVLHVRAPGGSMRPTIPRGALVRIGRLPPHGPTAGDVVLALTSEGEPVVHRVLDVRPDGIVMRGDAAIAIDPLVPFSSVIGIATHVRVNGIDRPLGRRPRRSVSVSALMMRRRIEQMVRRAR